MIWDSTLNSVVALNSFLFVSSFSLQRIGFDFNWTAFSLHKGHLYNNNNTSSCDQPLSQPSIVPRQADDHHDEDEEAREKPAHRHDLPVRHRGFVTSFRSVSGNLILVLFWVWDTSEIKTKYYHSKRNKLIRVWKLYEYVFKRLFSYPKIPQSYFKFTEHGFIESNTN